MALVADVRIFFGRSCVSQIQRKMTKDDGVDMEDSGHATPSCHGHLYDENSHKFPV